MKALNLTGKDTDSELSSIAKEANMQEIGERTKCMEKGYFIILVKKQHMMENGKMINSLGTGSFITKRQFH